MNQNIILFLILLIILFIISSSEKYYNIIKITDNPNLKNKNQNVNIKEDPCFLYENTNRTQTLYIKLINALKMLSNNGKKTLGQNCKQEIFIQGTTSSRLKTELNEVTNVVLDKINAITGFSFRIVYLDTITLFQDCYGNKNFIYNVFVNDPHEELDIRLYLNVIKYIVKCPDANKEKDITCTSVTTPGMKASGIENTFEIGYPQPEQLLPLPTEVISTGGGPDLLSAKGINIHKIPPIKKIYINEVRIYNTNAVINANGKCLQEGICGNIKDTTLSSSPYNGLTTPFQEPNCLRNQWPRLYNEPKCTKAWPSVVDSPYWDTKGIPTPPSCGTQEFGTRSSTIQLPTVPQYWPTLATLPRNSGSNYWLFNLTRGDVATEGADFTD